MSLKSFLLDDRRVERNAFVWNSVSTGLFALQSMLMTIVTQNRLGEAQTGVLAIGSAEAFLFGCVGTFGVSRFQASDVSRRFSFLQYVLARAATVGAMWVIAAGFLIWHWLSGAYDGFKIGIIALMVGLKTVDVVEDVVLSYFQQHRRLDVGARACAVRYVITMCVFTAATLILGNLTWALIVTLAVSVLVFLGLAWLILNGFVTAEDKGSSRSIFRLLRECGPMFVAGALTVYVNNAPRYAIDQASDAVTQAQYTFLATPVFAISLVATFLFNPLIARLATLWQEGDLKGFDRIIVRLLALITGVGILGCAAGYFTGLPILSWVFQVDLDGFLPEFMALLLAGYFVALTGLLSTLLTIIRRQAFMAWGYAAVSLLSLVVAASWVRAQGLMGASLLYLSLTGLLSLVFGVGLVVYLVRARR